MSRITDWLNKYSRDDASEVTMSGFPSNGGMVPYSVSASSGLVNWYDIAFDPEGYFDGRPSMFVSSSDRSDPNKNVSPW